jgi:anti-sigma factor RsiW
MSSEHVQEDVPLYALGLLEAGERATVERHLATCAACREVLAAHERVVGELASAVATAPRRDLRAPIVARHRRRFKLPTILPLPVMTTAAAAILLVAIGVATVEDVVRLEQRAGGSGGAAVVVARTGDAYMIVTSRDLPADRAYEAWIIRDGSAIAAGLAPAGRGLAVIRLGVALLPGDVAAITIEAAAGASAPTSDPILVGTRGGS